VDAFPSAQVHDLDRALMFPWDEQTPSSDVHRHVIEIAFDVGKGDGLDKMHGG